MDSNGSQTARRAARQNNQREEAKTVGIGDPGDAAEIRQKLTFRVMGAPVACADYSDEKIGLEIAVGTICVGSASGAVRKHAAPARSLRIYYQATGVRSISNDCAQTQSGTCVGASVDGRSID